MNTKKRSFTSLSAESVSVSEPVQQPKEKEPVVEIPAPEIPESVPEPLLYLEEGLFAVNKPLGWTSQDVVGKIRNVLEQDAKSRNVIDLRKKKRKPWMKVGHGGTLDPLATGTLVIGVGKGTKLLQKYLIGPKGYKAEITLGYQTTTLDSELTGSIMLRKSYDHVTSYKQINEVLQGKFLGKIQQIPPIFSALKRDGKKLYQLAREDGLTADDIQIESREVIIYKLELSDSELLLDDLESKNNNENKNKLSQQQPIEKFSINVECGGGTYIRSLVRDIGIELGTCATMTKLERTKQGHFNNKLEHGIVQYQINDKNNDGNIDDYTNVDDNDNDKEKDDEEKEENANADIAIATTTNTTTTNSTSTSTSSEDNKTNSNSNSNRIDKRKECNWTVETITDAIRSSRERLSLLADNDDGLNDIVLNDGLNDIVLNDGLCDNLKWTE
jgi:tRNA pseudouridine55 synthase